MSNPTNIIEFPAEQRAIRDKCFHPTGAFVEFLKEEVEQSIPARFEKIVRRYPHRLAIKAKDASFTYEELNDHSNRIAHSILAAVGAGNRPVAILMKHGASVVAAILGALKAGKIYVPFDPTYPHERLRFVLQDAQAELILVQPETGALATSVSEGKLQAIDVDHLSAYIANDDVGLHIPPSAFAYILYTSGSTGQPKGVVDNHRNVLHGTLRFTNPQHIGAEDRISLTHSCSSSASVRRIFPALLNGAALFPLDIKEGGLQGLGKFLNEEAVTIFGSGRIRDVVRSFDRSQTFPNLRLVSFGGEVVLRRDVDLFRKIFGPDCVFGIWMSSTEAGNITQFLIDDASQLTGDIVPAGYPATDVELMVLDETGAKLEPGEIGEIAVKSPYLSCGYWRRPELTKEKFRLDPDGGEHRIYRTGDVGRLTLNGCLFHLGRSDDQVKIRGYRVEIAEIQASILKLGLFSKAFVTARDQRSGDKSLVAYLVPENWPAPTTSALRKALATLLPSHMIPSVFIMLKALPLTPNGKVDRGALPEPGHSRPNLETLFVAPNSDTEKKIAEIWSDVLDVVSVGTDDNFFDLGGHSLLAAKVFARLDQAFGRVLPLSVLLEAPTTRALAERYEAPEIREKDSVLVALHCSGTLPPVYAVPGVFGDAVSYASLSRELGDEQPFFGFNAIGLDAGEAPLESIEEIARRNVSEIRSVHRNGPVALIGACFGAVVAYEMARQLTEAGEEVAFLGLLDPLRLEESAVRKDSKHTPWAYNRVKALVGLLAERLRLYREEMRGLSAQGRLNYIANKVHSLRGLIGNDKRFTSVARELYQLEVYRANHRASRLYHRKPIIGRLRALEIFESYHPRNLAVGQPDWARLWEGNVVRHGVPGKDSGDMVSRENAPLVATLLSERLLAAFAQEPASFPASVGFLGGGVNDHRSF